MTNHSEAAKAFGTVFSLFNYVTGKKLNMKEYSNRLMLQKLVYLVQSAGINYSYNYSWHVRGPYSVSLAADGFNFFAGEEIPLEYRLSGNEKIVADKLKKYFKDDVTTDEKLELLGSLVFIKKEYHIADSEKLAQKLCDYKPWFKIEQAREMVGKIEESGLFDSN